MIYTNGTRLYYYDAILRAYVCFCTLHGYVQLVTADREAAEIYVDKGYINFENWRESHHLTPQQLRGLPNSTFLKWKQKIKARFPNAYVY